MPRRYPPEIRRQVVELARSGTKVAQLVATHNAVAAIMRELGIKGLPNRRLPRSARVGRVGGPDQDVHRSGGTPRRNPMASPF
jgi:transposase-like protein